MQTNLTLVFACAHLTDERLFAHQVAALSPTHDCRVFAFRDLPTLGAMAEELLAHAPAITGRVRATEAAARKLGLQFEPVEVRTASELENALQRALAKRAGRRTFRAPRNGECL